MLLGNKSIGWQNWIEGGRQCQWHCHWQWTFAVCRIGKKWMTLALSMQISYLGRAQKCQAEGQPIMGIQIPCQWHHRCHWPGQWLLWCLQCKGWGNALGSTFPHKTVWQKFHFKRWHWFKIVDNQVQIRRINGIIDYIDNVKDNARDQTSSCLDLDWRLGDIGNDIDNVILPAKSAPVELCRLTGRPA